MGGNFIGPQAVRCIRDALDGPESHLTTNSQYMKIRAPSEPMKFYRKRVPTVIPIKVADRIIVDSNNSDDINNNNNSNGVVDLVNRTVVPIVDVKCISALTSYS